MLEQPIIKHTPFYPGQWGIKGSDSPLGIRTVPRGIVYYVNSSDTNASDNNDGTDPTYPLSTVLAAYTKCTDGQNDVVAVIGQNTQYPITAAFTWSKSFTHLVGVSADIPGVGQRVRLVAPDTADLGNVMTISGSGCEFKNIQWYNGSDANTDSGAVTVSGSRNYFENCFFAGMAHATPAARAGSYSLTVTGSENVFVRCSIGLQTIIRAAANAELVISGATCYRNRFIQCEFLSWSVTAGKFLAAFSATSVPWVTQFEDCLFDNLNMTAGGAAGAAITNAFADGSAAFHQAILRGKNQFVGCTGVADTLTHIWSAEPVPNTGFGISVNPAT
jgi:hypothetical protein